MATIHCRDCGEPRTKTPSNTLYCKKCRLLRDLDYWRVHTRVCSSEGCEVEYAPLGRNDRHCSSCDPGLRAYNHPCSLGGKTNPHAGWRLYRDFPVCAACLRDPAARPRLIAALERGQRSRRAANDYKESHA